jgi:hypothetical protein
MYNKLFTKILDSSIWLELTPTRIVWVTFIASMDRDGFVSLSSVGNVAARARVTEDEAAEAIRCLEAPDTRNPDQDNEGKRVERVPGTGWLVLNASKYRDIVTAEMVRAQNRERARRHRSLNGSSPVTPVTQRHENVTPSEAEAEERTYPPTPLKRGGSRHAPSRREREQAKRIRHNRHGCTHTPRCATAEACLLRVVDELRAGEPV